MPPLNPPTIPKSSQATTQAIQTSIDAMRNIAAWAKTKTPRHRREGSHNPQHNSLAQQQQ
jgi:hypothetical protein